VSEKPVVVITGTRTGIGKFLAEYYVKKGFYVIGCSRKQVDFELKNYQHFYLDISDEPAVKKMYNQVRKTYGRLDVLINNAGIASMNHAILTTIDTVNKVFNTNVVGTFLSCREAAKLMQMNKFGRIINFTTVATPLRLEGEAVYASSKAAVVSITQILARELADMGITVNAIGPVPVKTDLIRAVPREKIESLINRQAIRRYGEFKDIVNIIDFFLKKESNFITGQVIYLGGI